MIIKRVVNGYLIKDRKDVFVIEEQHDYEDPEGVKTFVNLLWKINELIGPGTSRYSKERVVIKLEPGDKYDDDVEGQEGIL